MNGSEGRRADESHAEAQSTQRMYWFRASLTLGFGQLLLSGQSSRILRPSPTNDATMGQNGIKEDRVHGSTKIEPCVRRSSPKSPS